MKIDDLDRTRIKRTVIALLKENPEGVRTTTVADDPRVADHHRELIETDRKAYHSIVGRLLSKIDRVVAVADAPGTKQDMLWRLT